MRISDWSSDVCFFRSRGVRRRGRRSRRGRPSGPRRAARAGVRRGRGSGAASQVRLDRCRALLGDGHPRCQLRSGRPASRAPRRGAGASRADHRRRARPAGVAERVLTRVRRLPAPATIGLVYLAARVVTTAFFLLAADLSGPGSRFGADATIADLAIGWDGQWYWFAAVNGYPSELPLTDAGAVAENPWAFLPVYPFLAAALGGLLGSWGAGAIVISLAAGYGACLALHRLLRSRVDEIGRAHV